MNTQIIEENIKEQLRPFFFPRAIAVAGISKDAWKFGSYYYLAFKQFKSQVPVYPISNRISEFLGEKVFPSIAELPENVDLAVICLPAPLTIEATRQCIDKKIPAVIIPSGGFRETATEEGRALENELAKLKGKGTRIIGPNCFGVYSPSGGVTILPGGNYSRTGGTVSFSAQSGGITEDFCILSQEYGFNIRHAVSYGNAVDVNELDLMNYYLSDNESKIVAAYLEGVRSGKEFFNVVKRLASIKPTIILKGGLTPSGARAAKSHTGSLAGNDRIWSAFFKQTRAIQVFNMEELIDTVAAFYHLPKTKDDRVAIVCGGGGVGVMASDISYRSGLTLASLSDKTINKLKSVLPPPGSSAHNPVDCDNPFPKAEILKEVMETLATSGEIGSIVIDKIALSVRIRQLLDYDKQVGWQDEPWLSEIPVIIRKKYNIPVAVVLREGGEPLVKVELEAEKRTLRKYYQENGIAVYPSMQRALTAMGRMINYYKMAGA